MASSKDYRGREIIINVGRGEPDADRSTAKRRKGMPQTSRADDGILTRRKKSGMEFYDLAQTKPFGSWVSNNFGHLPDFSIWHPPDPAVKSDELRESNPITLEITRAFEADVLGGTVPANFETHFRPVPKSVGNAFNIAFRVYNDDDDRTYNFASDEWKDKGLNVPQSILDGKKLEIRGYVGGQNATVVGGGDSGAGEVNLTLVIDTDPAKTKCTTGNTFDAGETVYHPQAADKWFLFPRLAFSGGYSAIPFTDGVEAWAFCNTFYSSIPRNFENPSQTLVGRKSDNPTEYAAAVAFHRSLVIRPGGFGAFGSRIFHVVGTAVSGGVERLLASGGGSFPLSGTTALDEISFESDVRPYFNNPGGNDPRFVGQLLGICKRGEGLLYFWRRTAPVV